MAEGSAAGGAPDDPSGISTRSDFAHALRAVKGKRSYSGLKPPEMRRVVESKQSMIV